MRRSSNRRSPSRCLTLARAVVVPFTLTALLVSSCGGGASARKVLTGAPDQTIAARTAAFSLRFQFPGAEGSQPLTITADGEFDYGAQTGQVTMPLDSIGLPGLPTGAKAEVILAGEVMYVRLPGVGTPAKPWIRADLANETSSQAREGLEQLGVEDPTAVLDALRGTASDVEKIGEEEVRGAKTTHYRGVADLEKAVEDAPASRRAQLERFARKAKVKELPLDVWIDEQGRARRLDYTLDVATPGGPPRRMNARTELFDFGLDVDVTAPPPDQVTDAGAL